MTDNNTVAKVVAALKNKEISTVELIKEYFYRIHNTESLNNFISLAEASALEQAEETDKLIASGETGDKPLLGVPVAVKDNIDVAGLPTTCASRAFADNTAAADAKVVKRLKAAGAVIVGKTNMDELAMGSTNESSAFGIVKNALDKTRVPGGSSGGSANAVAAKQAVCALGTDTGGSVRQPAAFCGVVGLKPTYGAVPASGLLGFSPSLDTVGMFAVDCDGVSEVFNAVASEKRIALTGEIKGLTVGIADEFINAVADADMRGAFDNAAARLERSGAVIKRVSVKSFAAALSAYHALSSAEIALSVPNAVADRARLALLGAEVKRRMITGALVTSGKRYDEIYLRAARVRAEIKREYLSALDSCDVLLCPATASTATPIGRKDPIKTHACDYFLAPVSLAGLPAVSVPCGTVGGLPVGVQIIGNYNCESIIMNAGKNLMRN